MASSGYHFGWSGLTTAKPGHQFLAGQDIILVGQCALLANHGHHLGWLGYTLASSGHHFGWSGCTLGHTNLAGQDIILDGQGAFRPAMVTILGGQYMIPGGQDARWLALGTKNVPPGLGRPEIQKN